MLILKKKDIFGYEGFLFGQKNPYTAKSVKGTMVSYIESDKLIQILNNFTHDKVNNQTINKLLLIYQLNNRKDTICLKIIKYSIHSLQKQQFYIFKLQLLVFIKTLKEKQSQFNFFNIYQIQIFIIKQDLNKQSSQIQSPEIQNKNLYINHCVSCDSINHSLNSCHIVQLILRYKKDKIPYFQERQFRKRQDVNKKYKTIIDRMIIEKEIINFQVNQDDNSIISDICSILNGDDDYTANEQSSRVINDDKIEENESQFSDDDEIEDQVEINNIKRKSQQQITRKSLQQEVMNSKEFLDLVRRKSGKELSQNIIKIQQDIQGISAQNLDQIDEGEAEEGEEDTQKSIRKKENSQFSYKDEKRKMNNSQCSQKEEQKNQLNLNPFSDMQIFKGESLKIITSFEKHENLHLSTPKTSNEKNYFNPQQSEISPTTIPGISLIKKKQTSISPIRTTKKSQSQLKKQMNTSITSQRDKIQSNITGEIPMQFRQFKQAGYPNNTKCLSNTQLEYENDDCCDLDDEENQINPQMETSAQKQSLTLQQKIALKRRKKYQRTYIEDERTNKAILGYREQQELLQQNQQSIPSEDLISLSLPSPAKIQIKMFQKINNQQELYFNNQDQSPIALIDSKIRRNTKKGTLSSNRNRECSDKKLSFTGLNKSNSVLYKQQSFVQKKVQDKQVSIQSPLIEHQPPSLTRIKGGPGTLAMIQSSPTQNKNSSDYSIRYQYGIQNIDCLITRKYQLMQQQKGMIIDFIFVQDNELDIDKMHKYQIYFPKGNINFIIKKLKSNQERIRLRNKNNYATNQFGSQKVTKPRSSLQHNTHIKLQSSRLLVQNGHSNSKTSLNAFDK